MSIATKTGDAGTTALMYGRRVSKSHPRIEACGAIDELNAAIGLARATAKQAFVPEKLLPIQNDLIALMGELATLPEDLERYKTDGYSVLGAERVQKLDEIVQIIEAQRVSFRGWATPGANVNSAALDVARTVCRRAERRISELQERSEIKNANILIYINRLSDALWLLARWVETHSAGE